MPLPNNLTPLFIIKTKIKKKNCWIYSFDKKVTTLCILKIADCGHRVYLFVVCWCFIKFNKYSFGWRSNNSALLIFRAIGRVACQKYSSNFISHEFAASACRNSISWKNCQRWWVFNNALLRQPLKKGYEHMLCCCSEFIGLMDHGLRGSWPDSIEFLFNLK